MNSCRFLVDRAKLSCRICPTWSRPKTPTSRRASTHLAYTPSSELAILSTGKKKEQSTLTTTTTTTATNAHVLAYSSSEYKDHYLGKQSVDALPSEKLGTADTGPKELAGQSKNERGFASINDNSKKTTNYQIRYLAPIQSNNSILFYTLIELFYIKQHDFKSFQHGAEGNRQTRIHSRRSTWYETFSRFRVFVIVEHVFF